MENGLIYEEVFRIECHQKSPEVGKLRFLTYKVKDNERELGLRYL